jgi:uncharacterized protein (DUF1499 family)
MSTESFPSLSPPRWPGRLVRFGLWTIGLGALLVVVAGPLNRFGAAGFRVALLALAGGALLLVLGALLAIVGLLAATAKKLPAPRGLAVAGVVVALAITGYLLSWLQQARGVPPIHEVSTDLVDPPPFVAVKEIRDRIPGLNPSDYVAQMPGRNGTIDVPALQRQAYSDVQPLVLQVPAQEAFARVEQAARELGWEIVAAVPEEGRLEATDTTRFFGFKDDVVVRLRSEGGATRIDVRSKSRVGLSDVGANAARIRSFLARVQNP